MVISDFAKNVILSYFTELRFLQCTFDDGTVCEYEHLESYNTFAVVTSPNNNSGKCYLYTCIKIIIVFLLPVLNLFFLNICHKS